MNSSKAMKFPEAAYPGLQGVILIPPPFYFDFWAAMGLGCCLAFAAGVKEIARQYFLLVQVTLNVE